MSIPKLSFHRPSFRFYVWQDGKRVYLGRGDDPAKPSMEVVAKYREAVRRILGDEPAKPELVPETLTVAELAAQYITYAETAYTQGQLRSIKPPLKHLVHFCGMVEAQKFGPRKLAEFQQYLVELPVRCGRPRSREGINKDVKGIKQVFKWAVSMELIPVSVLESMKTLSGLRFGRTKAPESPETPIVEDHQIRAVLPFLGRRVAAMVMLQRLTGMRPGEVCNITMEEIDRSVPGRWVYRPEAHKTRWRGFKRQVPIIGKALEVLLPWVRADGLPLFSPAEETADRMVAMRERRKSKVQPSQVNRGKEQPRKKPGERYTTDSYRQAIQYACEKAGIPNWSPKGLRKGSSQHIVDNLSMDHARALLGHTSAEVTRRYYATQDLAKAVEAVQALEAMG